MNDEAPSAPFEFAEGWPEGVGDRVAVLYAFDLDEVEGKERLGSLAFSSAPASVESLRSLLRDLARERWGEIPPPLSGDLENHLNAVNTTLEQMAALSADQSDAAAQKQALQDQLTAEATWFEQTVKPACLTVRIERVVSELGGRTDLDEMRGLVSRLKEETSSVNKELESRKDLVTGLREAVGESAREELAAVFNARAGEQHEAARRWLRALAGAAAAAIGAAIVTYLALRPPDNSRDASDLAALALAAFIVGIFVFGVRVCAQQYRVSRHLETVARSKASALSTFTRLAASIEQEDMRSAAALALAEAVFRVEDTGHVASSTADQVTLLERAVLPRLNRGTAEPESS